MTQTTGGTGRHPLAAAALLALSGLWLVLTPTLCQAQAAAHTATATPAWVSASNTITRGVLEAQGAFAPEFASQQGLTQFDGLAMDLGPRIHQRSAAAMDRLLRSLRQRLATERDPNLRQDLQILIDSVALSLDGARLSARLELAWTDAPEAMFRGIRGLLDEQMPPERRAKALALLRRYVGQHPGSAPLTRLARERFDESRQPGRIGPVKAQVEQAIANAPTYAKGIRELFGQYGIGGAQAEAALAAMDQQIAEFSAWQQRSVLPLARSDFRRPPALYAQALREVGIDIAPADLIRQAQQHFVETRAAMEALAPQVARAKGLDQGMPAPAAGDTAAGGPQPATDYRALIRQLKRETIPDDQLEARYRAVNEQLEAVIRRERIVTLPSRPMGMRLASVAESAAQPAPHMQPPPLVGNTGQRGVFVLPVKNPAAGPGEAYDDFNFPAATWTLSAHEGRPGHELQFSAMIERGVSLARALYAFNSVNVEGWALYAEAQALPYEPLEGQLIALQIRLLRSARAMLDPMLHLGLISVDDARRVLREEVVLSPAMVRQEIDRYTYRNPGQAGTYFYGYARLLQLRAETELALGPRFDRQAFNDFLLDQGLLPPTLLAKAVREQFVPARR